MKYTRDNYNKFLETEIQYQVKDFEDTINTKASVLKERGDVFVGKFLKMQPNGQAVFKVRHSDNMPRKNSFWTATYFVGEMCKFKNWGNHSWVELRKQYQKDFSDALCVWISKSDEKDFCLVGIKNLTFQFAQLLEKEQPLIAFGPKDPPLQYLYNLLSIVKEESCSLTKSILDFDESSDLWSPLKIEAQTDLNQLLLEQFKSTDRIVIQGPPGTGKTYRMAKLTAQLLRENKSVMVTALTNQALMELAKKEDLKPFLDAGKVSKTSLTVDEKRELSKLESVTDNKCFVASGSLTLASFYVSSGWAVGDVETPFDYVIMDEASQALLPMIAATTKLGRKIIWIGDQSQLPPIVLTKEDIITRFDWVSMINGFESICRYFNYKSYMLSDTFRLTQRGADCSGVFYQNVLRSVSTQQSFTSNIKELNQSGGPVLVNLDLKVGDKTPSAAFRFMLDLVQRILKESPKAEIAILAKFRETVRYLQKSFVLNWTTRLLPDNLRIETVDRVQGLTVDYCFFLIPNASLRYSLNKELFNVATSRATRNTIIVAFNSLLRANMSHEVRAYLLKAQGETPIQVDTSHNISTESGAVNVKVTGKIDLSQFETSKQKSVRSQTKENIYIIDTNVFVNCPDIIAKIDEKYKVVLSAKVIDELDKLKITLDADGKRNVEKALRNINKALDTPRVSMELSDVSLLPSDFNKRSPDNNILTVALKFQNDEQNPILLTSDNGLQVKAKGLGIATITLKEYLKR